MTATSAAATKGFEVPHTVPLGSKFVTLDEFPGEGLSEKYVVKLNRGGNTDAEKIVEQLNRVDTAIITVGEDDSRGRKHVRFEAEPDGNIIVQYANARQSVNSKVGITTLTTANDDITIDIVNFKEPGVPAGEPAEPNARQSDGLPDKLWQA